MAVGTTLSPTLSPQDLTPHPREVGAPREASLNWGEALESPKRCPRLPGSWPPRHLRRGCGAKAPRPQELRRQGPSDTAVP